jgi:hypothetical protein
MPRPSTAAQRPDLAVTAMTARDSHAGFIGLQVMPLFRVDDSVGQYPVIPPEVMFALQETKRAARGNYQRSDWDWDWDNYATTENGFEEAVDDKEVKLYRRYFDAEKMSTRRAVNVILRKQEYRIASALFNASNFTAHALTNEWDDATNATPKADVDTARETIHDAIGMNPNTLIIPYKTYLAMGRCDEIIDRIKYTNPTVQRGDVAPALLAQYFEVEKVIVGDAMYNGAKKGQTASLTQMWNPEYAMLCVTDGSENFETPSIGRTFLWVADSPENVVVESYRDETVRGDVVRVRHDTDEEFISTDCAYLFSNVNTI